MSDYREAALDSLYHQAVTDKVRLKQVYISCLTIQQVLVIIVQKTYTVIYSKLYLT